MALHSDLLAQARHLASKEPQRPKQASLRRAASSAYYALFHFLIGKSTRLIVSGGGTDRQVLRNAVSRAFKHAHMASVSRAFSGPNNNAWKALFPGPVPSDLVTVASTFADLQQARHEADYDLTRDFTRAEVLGLITRVQYAMNVWPNIADAPMTRAYLLGLVLTTRAS